MGQSPNKQAAEHKDTPSESDSSSEDLPAPIPSDPEWERARKEWRMGHNGAVTSEIKEFDAQMQKRYESEEKFDSPVPLGVVVDWLSAQWELEQQRDFPL
jgi:hypothetical protein